MLIANLKALFSSIKSQMFFIQILSRWRRTSVENISEATMNAVGTEFRWSEREPDVEREIFIWKAISVAQKPPQQKDHILKVSMNYIIFVLQLLIWSVNLKTVGVSEVQAKPCSRSLLPDNVLG